MLYYYMQCYDEFNTITYYYYTYYIDYDISNIY